MTAYTAGGSFTFLGAALVVLGALLVRSPLSGGATEAASTIPRWVGWLAVVSGLLTLLFWLAAIDEALFLIAAIGLIGGLLTQLAVAWWLLKAAPELLPSTREAGHASLPCGPWRGHPARARCGAGLVRLKG